MKIWSTMLMSIVMMSPAIHANAQNYPCSQSMGGSRIVKTVSLSAKMAKSVSLRKYVRCKAVV